MMRIVKPLYAAALLMVMAATAAQAQQRVPVTVVSVKDGDTLQVREFQHDIRLASIDAPETGHGRNRPGQPFGQAARTALIELLGPTGKAQIQAACYEQDRYERHVCDVFVNGQSVGSALVSRGLAWANTSNSGRYLRDKGLLQAQQGAKARGVGVWSAPGPLPPWDWRKSCWEGDVCPQ